MNKLKTNSYWEESRFKAKLFSRRYWKKRNEFAKALENAGFRVSEYDNCWRLHAFKSDEEFIIDCQADKTWMTTSSLAVKWVYDWNSGPVIITDIPSSGRYGILNRDSKYAKEIEDIINGVYGDNG